MHTDNDDNFGDSILSLQEFLTANCRLKKSLVKRSHLQCTFREITKGKMKNRTEYKN